MADSAQPDYIAWALRELRAPRRQRGYLAAQAYYDGRHDLRFATEKFQSAFAQQLREVSDNLCPAVVDSIADRLRVTGFQEGDAMAKPPAPPAAPPAAEAAAIAAGDLAIVNPPDPPTPTIADKAWDIWGRNRMDIRAPETHHEALLKGDGFVLVWPDPVQRDQAIIWSLPAQQVVVAYDPDRPGVLRRAARVWQDDDDGRVHLDLFFPDRVERYVTQGAKKSLLPAGLGVNDLQPWRVNLDQGDLEDAAAHVEQHSLGVVPIVHFPNRRYHAYGISELGDVVPLQDALNKAVCDMLVAMEFSAFAQRWATGIDVGELGPDGKPVQEPFNVGNDRVVTASSPEAKFGDFRSTDLTQYVEVQENLRSEIARVSGTPLHYLFITRGDFPSGEAMKSAEARFTRKVDNRQTSFGCGWEQVMAIALTIESEIDKPADSTVSAMWESSSPLEVIAGEPVPDQISETIRV